MDTQDGAPRTGALRTVLRRVVFGAFVCSTTVIGLLIGMAVAGATGLAFDPHGYGMIFGTFLAALLTPVALALWWLYRALGHLDGESDGHRWMRSTGGSR